MMQLVGKKMCTLVVYILAALTIFAGGEPKMPTLNWMGREKATNAVKDVVMKILREDKSLGYKAHTEKKAEVAGEMLPM